MSKEITANLWCQDCTCGRSGKDRDFQFETTEKEKNSLTCPYNESLPLKYMGQLPTVFAVDKAKHAKGRSPKEKRERANKDFQKNILPTLPPGEASYFKKKFADQKAGKRNPLK